MTADDIAKVPGGRRAGASWMARCPAHNDREPSLSIRQGEDGKVLVRCHAGCEQALVIAVLRSRGLWQGGQPSRAATNRDLSGPGDGHLLGSLAAGSGR